MLEMSPSYPFSRAARAVEEKYYDVAENSTFPQDEAENFFRRPGPETKRVGRSSMPI